MEQACTLGLTPPSCNAPHSALTHTTQCTDTHHTVHIHITQCTYTHHTVHIHTQQKTLTQHTYPPHSAHTHVTTHRTMHMYTHTSTTVRLPILQYAQKFRSRLHPGVKLSAGKKVMGDLMEEAELGAATPPTQDEVVTKTIAETSARSSPVPSDTNSKWLSVCPD